MTSNFIPKDPRSLLDYSQEHLQYEIEQFFELPKCFAQECVRLKRNALITAFWISYRNLMAFLFVRPKFDTDIVAKHYNGNQEWNEGTHLPESYHHVHKTIAHLTETRSLVHKTKEWDIPSIQKTMARNLLKFCEGSGRSLHLEVVVTIQRYADLLERSGKIDSSSTVTARSSDF